MIIQTVDKGPMPLGLGSLPFRFDPPLAKEFNLNVPAAVHFIWLGSPIPQKYADNIERIRKHNPRHTITLWTDAIVAFRNRDLFDVETNLGAKADILRYEIVHNFGGIYLDVDHVSHGPGSLHPDMRRSFVQVSGTPWFNTTNSDFGFAKGSEFMAYVIRNLRDPRVRAQAGIPARTGPTFFTTCVVSFGDERIVHKNGSELLAKLEHTADHNWRER